MTYPNPGFFYARFQYSLDKSYRNKKIIMDKSAPSNPKRHAGMTGFIIVWIGQIISMLASRMSGFGLSIWMFEQTKSATAMGLMQVSYILPFLLLSPIAGVMVDRYNRKLMMMISDFAAVTATFAILIMQATGHLQFWHLYIANVLYGLGNTFQWPAYSAAISTMVPKEQYGRANGLMSLLEAGPGVLAPMLAGAVLAASKTNGLTIILLIDVITFFIALGALLIVHVPQPEKTVEGQNEKGSIWKEAAYGFTYIFKRPSLLGLQMIFFFGNLFSGIGFTVFAPMILLRTDNNSVIFGAVNSAAAIGGVAGGTHHERLGRVQEAHPRCTGGLDRGRSFYGHLRVRHRPGLLDPLHHRTSSRRPTDQHLQPVHLAGQGGSRYPGTRLFSPPPDRLVHPAHRPHHCRADG